MKFPFFHKKTQPTSGFTDFFLNSSSKEKKKVIKRAVREANKDQRDLLSKYDHEFSRSI